MSDERYIIHQGDSREVLKTLPDCSVHTCITSPPYFGLRDYGVDGQIGLEQTPDEYVRSMVELFREVRRVLRDDGTLWLNLGDSYAAQRSGTAMPAETLAGGIGGKGEEDTHRGHGSTHPHRNASAIGLKHKDLIGIPWRVALALQADGWYLRQDIIWHKPNPMPESVTDRCTKAHEYIFLLSKQPKYYFDNEAIKEPVVSVQPPRRFGRKEYEKAQTEGGHKAARDIAVELGQGTESSMGNHYGRVFGGETKRNKRSVWTVTTKPFRGAHFATFPEDLILPCVRAGTGEYGCCSKCGKPWEREVEVKKTFESGSGRSGNLPEGKYGKNLQGGGETKDIRRGPVCHSKTIGWIPSCDCEDAKITPCTVLDPFNGAATTGVVALKEGRRYIGIELNPDYIKLSEQRIKEQVPETLTELFE